MVTSAVNFLSDRFANPSALALLLLLPVLAAGAHWIRRRRCRAMQTWLGEQRAGAWAERRQRLAMASWAAGIVLVIIGIAGPQWGRDPSAPPARGRDIWITLDVSRSMLAEDPQSRLDRAKRYVRELLDDVQRHGDYRLGLIVFAGKAKVLCPLTEDLDHFRFALELAHPDWLGPSGRLGLGEESGSFGTSLRAALTLTAGFHDDRLRGFEHVLLITDGDDLAGGWQSGAQRLKNAGMVMHVFGIGDKDKERFIPSGRADDPYLALEGERVTTRRHDELLEELATVAQGDYQTEESGAHPLVQWFELAVAPLPLREWTEDRQPLLVQRYAWFFGGALVLFLLGLVRSDRPLPVEERA